MLSVLRAECGSMGTFARCLPCWIYRLITIPSICFIRRVVSCQVWEQKKLKQVWSPMDYFLEMCCVCKIRHISIMLAKYRQSITVLCYHICCPYGSSSSKCLLVIEPPKHHEIVHILMAKKISHYLNVFFL